MKVILTYGKPSSVNLHILEFHSSNRHKICQFRQNEEYIDEVGDLIEAETTHRWTVFFPDESHFLRFIDLKLREIKFNDVVMIDLVTKDDLSILTRNLYEEKTSGMTAEYLRESVMEMIRISNVIYCPGQKREMIERTTNMITSTFPIEVVKNIIDQIPIYD
jgi:hypothetical protein